MYYITELTLKKNGPIGLSCDDDGGGVGGDGDDNDGDYV